ncbi:c-type cytochrome [Pararhodonellum marinum]|uniref:c-type cytochrome n=1 Tax=Pararhodonellum marinum TaxID=2755358 RepID=UPI00188F56F5|nr:c-type cytochrome [Pararhodonellum marinum]
MNILKPFSLGLIAFSVLAVSCGGGSDSSTSTTTTTPPPSAPAELSLEDRYKDDPDYIKGLALMKESDCPSCHMVERKIVGPSYAEVAAKYENTEENVNLLAGRVISGAVGVWGEIPMPAHPTLSEEDAKQMVKYVLLLKK